MHGGMMAKQPTDKVYERLASDLPKSITERALGKLVEPMVPASFPLGRAWFLVCCMAGQENGVAAEIRALGLGAYTPQQSRRVLRRGRRMEIKSSLFAGYLFTSFDRERDEWGAISDIDGVIGVLKVHGIPVRVPTTEIDRLRRAEQIGLFDFTNPAANFTEGELVEIEQDGPLKGMIARIKSATAKKRVKILLDTLGTMTVDPLFLKRLG